MGGGPEIKHPSLDMIIGDDIARDDRPVGQGNRRPRFRRIRVESDIGQREGGIHSRNSGAGRNTGPLNGGVGVKAIDVPDIPDDGTACHHVTGHLAGHGRVATLDADRPRQRGRKGEDGIILNARIGNPGNKENAHSLLRRDS